MIQTLKKLELITLGDTGLVSTRKDSMILKYCIKYGLKSVKDFLDFYYIHGVLNNSKLEISGLVDLINYKYFGIINDEFIGVLESKFTELEWLNFQNKECYKKDFNLLRRLGLTNDEVNSFIYFAKRHDNLQLVEIIKKFLEPESRHIYIGAYLETIFMEKMRLIYDYYLNKSCEMSIDSDEYQSYFKKNVQSQVIIDESCKNIKISETGLVNKDKYNVFYNFCQKRGINTLQELFEYIEKNGIDNKSSQSRKEILGLINLIKFKYTSKVYAYDDILLMEISNEEEHSSNYYVDKYKNYFLDLGFSYPEIKNMINFMFYNLKGVCTIGDVINEAFKELMLTYPESKLVYASKLALLSKHYSENLNQNNIISLKQHLETYRKANTCRSDNKLEELDSLMAYKNYLANKVDALKAEIAALDDVIEQRNQFVSKDEVISLTKKYKESNK